VQLGAVVRVAIDGDVDEVHERQHGGHLTRADEEGQQSRVLVVRALPEHAADEPADRGADAKYEDHERRLLDGETLVLRAGELVSGGDTHASDTTEGGTHLRQVVVEEYEDDAPGNGACTGDGGHSRRRRITTTTHAFE
jgi:hypothetical protein